jgi:Right handed beta helix region
MRTLLRTHHFLRLMLVVLLAGLLVVFGERLNKAYAASIVTVTRCPTETALIADIGTVGPGGTVRFSISSPCTISIKQTLVISQDLTLDNKGKQVTLDGGGLAQVLLVNPHVILTVSALTIANGQAGDGGGLFAHSGSTVNISNSTFANNSAQFGGGLFVDSGSTVRISNSTFTKDSAQFGGGLFAYSGSTVRISNSTFTNNSAQFGSGLLASANCTVYIDNSTFANNSAQFGGDLFADSGSTVRISNSTFTKDSAQFGSGLLANANSTVHIDNSTFANNSAQFGGSLFADSGSTVRISNSTFTKDSAQFGGGLFAHSGSTVRISNSTFANNSATSQGGAFFNGLDNGKQVTLDGGGLAPVLLVNPHVIFTFNALTFANGQAGDGGGLFADANSTVRISNSTFANNSATSQGGAFFNSLGKLRIGQSIVANNTPGGNCSPSGSITDTGYNLSNDTSCGFTTANHSMPNTNPQLDPAGLKNNGGPTQTIALLPGSPAIDQIPSAMCLVDTDQRGFPRPDNNESVCDIGAYEHQD